MHSFPAEQYKQNVELTAPTVVEYVPAGQLVQTADDGLEDVSKNVPAGQLVHADVLRPVKDENVPEGQRTGAVPAGQYIPAGQGALLFCIN